MLNNYIILQNNIRFNPIKCCDYEFMKFYTFSLKIYLVLKYNNVKQSKMTLSWMQFLTVRVNYVCLVNIIIYMILLKAFAHHWRCMNERHKIVNNSEAGSDTPE